MTTGHYCELPRIRDQVGLALHGFLDRQRAVLGGIGPELLPWLDTITALLASGKRLRPAFCYWGWRAAGGDDGPPVLAAAAALELLHASALVHDDLMDGSETRRGRPSVHRAFAARHAGHGWRGRADAFGAGAAILIGDILLAWTDELYHGSGLPQDALQRGRPVLDAMRAELICGQYLDLLGQAAGDSSVAGALRVIRYKTAKYTIERPLLLGAALAGHGEATPGPGEATPWPGEATPGPGEVPAGGPGEVMPGAPDEARTAAFTGYGIPLGVAFQLRDDVLGVFGDPARTGKPADDDLREGKRTVLVAIARERATPAQRDLLDRRLGDPGLDAPGAAELRAIITATGALAECELMIEANVAEALRALDKAPFAGQPRQALAELAVVATARSE